MAINVNPVMTAEEYQKIIDAYKKQSPLKYEAKKEYFEAKLKTLAPAKKTKE